MGLLNKKHRTSAINRRRSLNAVPVLHNSVKITNNEDQTAHIEVDQKRGTGLMELLRPPVTHKNYDLDEFGAYVINQVNNERTVREIVDNFQKRYKLSLRESEMSVTAFLKMLMKRQVISIAMAEEDN